MVLVVSQFYESQVYDEYVIKGNAAVLKCNIPSFVSDHVEIVEWIDSNGSHYTRDDNAGNKMCFVPHGHRIDRFSMHTDVRTTFFHHPQN